MTPDHSFLSHGDTPAAAQLRACVALQLEGSGLTKIVRFDHCIVVGGVMWVSLLQTIWASIQIQS
jgi:hypothetical protein